MNTMNLIGWGLFVVAWLVYISFGAVPAMIVTSAALVSHIVSIYQLLRKK